MKASELIKDLQKMIEIEGDFEMLLLEKNNVNDKCVSLAGIVTRYVEGEKSISAILCDDNAMDAFSD